MSRLREITLTSYRHSEMSVFFFEKKALKQNGQIFAIIKIKRMNGMEKNWQIRTYKKTDEKELFTMMEKESDWHDYCFGGGKTKYATALETSLTYLLLEENKICGYARCREDDGFGVYVYDLLVNADSRGKNYGRYLMEQACKDFPDQMVYVMSDVDPYYEKQGYQKEGTIFIVKQK